MTLFQKDNISEKTESIWHKTVHLPSFRSLDQDIHTDVAIIGGGLTGIVSAYRLAVRGVKVALVEADRLASSTTGNTTAKITVQHGLIYQELIAHFGKEKARQYFDANNEALSWLRKLCQSSDISCTYATAPAILYAATDNERRSIEREKEAYDCLGIPAQFSDSVDLPIDTKGGLTIADQAQFHPLMFLHFLVSELVRMGAAIYEGTLAYDLEKKPSLAVVTKDGRKIHCRDVLICSHFPFYDANRLYFARMYPERSYLIACADCESVPQGMYLSAGDPRRSLRSAVCDGRQIVLVGGENHKTGQGGSTTDHYIRLQGFADAVLGENQMIAHWSAQDYTSLDKVPYIGLLAKNEPHLYVAAGFRKWGMTTAVVAAKLFSDTILGKHNPYTELFNPSRFEADPMIKTFIIEGAIVGKELVKGKLDRKQRLLDELGNNQGVIVTINGQRAGAYRDEEGSLSLVNTTCTHMGCEVNWNQAEKTWDCPCHGSRFSANGEVIDGPALDPLKKLYQEPSQEQPKG
ncbi:FAD-dependent oxidoreductase [Sporolactobacillus spathodeae]|uniref:Glycine/D-amino acid oxidase-like deaminating enzyme/nitrite reductase/ring-hydroxylating ferredoxin subunit n=1 Tax=Sporolactobacillus spathodeae TaxID=1465502 RepID=A0ABS2Q6R8_9BACL|nr:FAD-dependent oxidoreductase [Sporolactobacillus spathodeae]MBM7657487.1 glycine/D-amino acid oxidase-like deaminating enzyme/nitrite reductase/ring-hydroxylating ferredoxin subunit [Sporolactobacillus spathodeae]